MKLRHQVETKVYYLIGDPIDHACSPYVNSAAFEFLNIDALCLPLLVKREDLGAFVDMVKTFDFPGFYLTMPHKADIINYLDECDPLSKAFQSVNLVRNNGGKLTGIGLDGVGMGETIERKAGGPGSLKGKRALILGAGSVAG